MYWSQYDGTPFISRYMGVDELADSVDKAVDVVLPQIIATSAPFGAYCTSLFITQVDIWNGGQLASAGTWVEDYFVARSYIELMKNNIGGVVWGRYDVLNVKGQTTNSLFDLIVLLSNFFHAEGNLYDVPSVNGIAVVDEQKHGYALIPNRTTDSRIIETISIDGFIVPVISIQAQVASSLGDINPNIRESGGIEPYSITLIQF
jgi:hypothetical protein